MKLNRNFVFTLACVAGLFSLPVYAEDHPSPTPTASPTATPHVEPTASPTATPGENHEPSPTPTASPTATPHVEPTASPTATPEEHHEPSPTPTPSGSVTPSPTPHEGGDDHGSGKSLHGLYEGTTSAGAIAIIYIQDNKHIQINILDDAAQAVGFAEGAMTNNTFTFPLTNGQTIVGTAGEDTISGTVGGATFQALRASEIGDSSSTGRFAGVAVGPNGETRVMFIIDAAHHITMVQMSGTPPNVTRTGGFGFVAAPVAPSTDYTFVLNHTIGSSSQITGTFKIVEGVFSGVFTTSAGTFNVNSFKSTLVNKLANISTRGFIGAGEQQLIGGFIITGGPKLVLVRAMGPSLAAAGVSQPIANPALQLFTGSTPVAENDDWQTNSNAAQITASGLAPTNDLESALLVRLEPGAYTTVVTGDGTSTGVGLVEIYEAGAE